MNMQSQIIFEKKTCNLNVLLTKLMTKKKCDLKCDEKHRTMIAMMGTEKVHIP